MTIGDWVTMATERLLRSGVEAPRLEAQVLAAHVELRDRSWVVAHPNEPIADLAAETLLQRREAGEPIAYILGWREFYGSRFQVDPRVLVPRHETEVLVEAALEMAGGAVLDLCCGSGCIGVTLALERPEWTVTLSDVDSGALEVARANASALSAPVSLAHCDLARGLRGPFDLIVSNPPYVADGAELPRDVALFEPTVALFAGPNGLEMYQRMARELTGLFAPEGVLLVEIGDGMEEQVSGCFASWEFRGEWPDLGGNVRVLGFSPR